MPACVAVAVGTVPSNRCRAAATAPLQSASPPAPSSLNRPCRYGARCRNVLDIYLPPNVQLPGSGDLLNCWTTASGADWHEGAGTAAGSAGTDAAAGADAGGSGGGAGGAAGFQAGGSGGEGGAAWAKAGGAPVVLLCHGGVWASGSKVSS